MSTKINVRKPRFDFNSEIPNHWFADSALFTHLANALFLSFPQGEKFFMRSVQAFAKNVNDPGLKEEIKAFISQEAQHSLTHEKHFDLLREQGYPVDQILKTYNIYASDGLENMAEKLFGKRMHLAMTAAAEHFTALFAEQAFEYDIFSLMQPTMGRLAAWHAVEELEHKSVAYDVMQNENITYAERMTGLLIVSTLLSGVTTMGMIQLLLTDKEVDLQQLLENAGLVLSGLLPAGAAEKENKEIGPGFLNDLVKGVLDYMRPDFHPDQRDNRGYVEQASEQGYLQSA